MISPVSGYFEGELVFSTNVGSHMWKMNTPESDIDMFAVYRAPVKDIMLGKEQKSKHFDKIQDFGPGVKDDVPVDLVIHEVGKVVEMLKKGNVNFLWGVMSPIIEYECEGSLQKLRSIVMKNLSKNVYHSIRGLANKNYHKYLAVTKLDGGISFGNNEETKERLGVTSPLTDVQKKKSRIIARTLLFGERLLVDYKFKFRKLDEDVSPNTIKRMIEKFEGLYEKSTLPVKPPYPELYDNWLIDERMSELIQ